MISSKPRPHFTPGKDPVPILQETGWAPGPVWTGGKSRPHWDSIPDRPVRSQSLYRLSYPVHNICYCFRFFVFKNCVIPKLRDLKLLKSASVSYAMKVTRVLTRVREAVSNMTRHGQDVLLHVTCSVGHAVRISGCLIGSYLGLCQHDVIESRRHSFLSRSAFEIMNTTLQWS